MLRPKFLAKFRGVNWVPNDANIGLGDSENKENPPAILPIIAPSSANSKACCVGNGLPVVTYDVVSPAAKFSAALIPAFIKTFGLEISLDKEAAISVIIPLSPIMLVN